MKTLAHVTLVAASLMLMGLLPVPRPTPPPAARCAAAKTFAAAKAARVRLACVAKATVAGTDEDAGCHGRADGRLTDAVSRAEARGGCLTTGDGPILAVAVDACVSTLRGMLRPQLQASTCTGGTLKTTGATILGKARCQRSAVLRVAAPSAACLQKRDGILDAKFAKLDPGASCLTVGDAAPVRAAVDQCVAGIMGPVPATTTTSLVAAPSTSTTTIGGSGTTTSSTSSTSTSTSATSTSSSSSTSTTSTSSTTSTIVYTCGGNFPLCAGTCPPGQTCGGLLCACQP
jgi:hypothetical protein